GRGRRARGSAPGRSGSSSPGTGSSPASPGRGTPPSAGSGCRRPYDPGGWSAPDGRPPAAVPCSKRPSRHALLSVFAELVPPSADPAAWAHRDTPDERLLAALPEKGASNVHGG